MLTETYFSIFRNDLCELSKLICPCNEHHKNVFIQGKVEFKGYTLNFFFKCKNINCGGRMNRLINDHHNLCLE